MEFVHIGAPTTKKMPNEVYAEGMKVWISDPDLDDFKFEFLRFEPDSWLAEEIQTRTHIACQSRLHRKGNRTLRKGSVGTGRYQ
jgi:hypothetical protein